METQEAGPPRLERQPSTLSRVNYNEHNPFASRTPGCPCTSVLKGILVFPLTLFRLIFGLGLGLLIVYLCGLAGTCCCCCRRGKGRRGGCWNFFVSLGLRLVLHGFGVHWISVRYIDAQGNAHSRKPQDHWFVSQYELPSVPDQQENTEEHKSGSADDGPGGDESCGWSEGTVEDTRQAKDGASQGVPVSRQDRAPEARVIIANHVSFLDVPIMLRGLQGQGAGFPVTLAKKAVGKIPIVGRLLRASNGILVDRHCKGDRARVKREMDAVADAHGTPPLLLFPEGTTTDGTVLINFKHGAFGVGQPVQPMFLQFPFRFYHPDYGYGSSLVRALSQVYNSATLNIMPIYVPSAAETGSRDGVAAFTDNVREFMSRLMSVPLSHHTTEDYFMSLWAGRASKHISLYASNLRRLGIDRARLKPTVKLFARMADARTGEIHFPQFCCVLAPQVFGPDNPIVSRHPSVVSASRQPQQQEVELPSQQQADAFVDDLSRSQADSLEFLESMFAHFDSNSSGSLNFVEFVVGLAVMSQLVESYQNKLAGNVSSATDGKELDRTVQAMDREKSTSLTRAQALFVLSVLDVDGDQQITREDLYRVLQATQSDRKADELVEWVFHAAAEFPARSQPDEEPAFSGSVNVGDSKREDATTGTTGGGAGSVSLSLAEDEEVASESDDGSGGNGEGEEQGSKAGAEGGGSNVESKAVQSIGLEQLMVILSDLQATSATDRKQNDVPMVGLALLDVIPTLFRDIVGMGGDEKKQ